MTNTGIATLVCAVALIPSAVYGQAPRKAETPTRSEAFSHPNVSSIDAAPRAASNGGGHATAIGAFIGAAAGAGVAAWAANSYGNNEGGRFCSRCFVEWGAVAIPAGAVVGAVIGWQVGRAASPQIGRHAPGLSIAPVVGQRGAAVAGVIRY